MNSVTKLAADELPCPYPLVAIEHGRRLAVLLFKVDEEVFERACPLVLCAFKPLSSMTFRREGKVFIISIVEYSDHVEELVEEARKIKGVEVAVLRDDASEKGVAVCDKVFPLVFGDRRLIVFMAEELVKGILKLRSKVGPAADAIVYHIGYCYGISIGKYLLDNLGLGKTIPILGRKKTSRVFAKLATATGWGIFKIEEIDTLRLRALVSVGECWEAKAYLHVKGRSNAPVCRFTAGVMAGCTAAFLGRDAQCVEKDCAAMGAAKCVFEIKAI